MGGSEPRSPKERDEARKVHAEPSLPREVWILSWENVGQLKSFGLWSACSVSDVVRSCCEEGIGMGHSSETDLLVRRPANPVRRQSA